MSKGLVDNRPWGRFEQFTLNERTTVKLLYVKKGHRLSYQYHKKRSEFWKVVKGKIRVTINGKVKTLSEGASIKVLQKSKHRIEGLTGSIVLEISYGKFDEHDIVRISDDYKRTAT